jgi:hypothetical protein
MVTAIVPGDDQDPRGTTRAYALDDSGYVESVYGLRRWRQRVSAANCAGARQCTGWLFPKGFL